MITHNISVPNKSSDNSTAQVPEQASAAPSEIVTPPVNAGNGSVAHQIINKFVSELDGSDDEEIKQIASNLRSVVFSGKPTELELKIAMFGV